MSNEALILFLVFCNLLNIYVIYLQKKHIKIFKKRYFYLLNEQSLERLNKENKDDNINL